jgi:hypothetical protein
VVWKEDFFQAYGKGFEIFYFVVQAALGFT